MIKQVSAAGAPSEPVGPVGTLGLAGPHLAAVSVPAFGFQEQPEPPFGTMPEAMPPPPMRPELPPDSSLEAERRGLFVRLLGGKQR